LLALAMSSPLVCALIAPSLQRSKGQRYDRTSLLLSFVSAT
jgi:hypothetical protein